VLSAIVLSVALVYFSLKIANISYQDELQTIDSEVAMDDIEIYRDFYGIPYLKLNSDKDFYFAMGYEHAFSRLWQMDFMRRAASGRLSEIFGKRTVNVDKFMRALEMQEIANQLYSNISPKSKEILINYSAGINSYIQNNQNRLSFEFGTLNYMPEKWTPEHSLMIGRLMAFEMSISFWIETAYAEIANKYDLETARRYIPDYDENAPYVTDNNISKYNQEILKEKNIDNKDLSAIKGISNIFFELKEVLGWQGSAIGSNSWVANKNFDDTLSAIHANDPHLSFGLPAKWTFMQIHTPKKHILGFSIPGIPAFISGRNNNITWGITNMMADISDLYVERLDSSKKNYFYNEKWNKIIYEKDTIKINNSNDLIYFKSSTHRSAIISDLHLFTKDTSLLKLDSSSISSDFYNKYEVTFNWAAKFESDEIIASDKILNSNNFKDFREALKTWGFPALNFSYGDKKGNIGIVPSGIIPKRGDKCEPNLPNPGWEKDTDWKGFYNNEFNSLLNPEKKFAASANNKLSENDKFFISNHWEPDSRIKRIEEMLAITEKYSVRDAQIMQSDVLSPYARELCKISVPILENLTKIMSQSEKDALELIKNWDYIISPVGPSSAIYNVFFERLVYNTFYDELGERIYRQYTFVSNVPTRRLMELLQSGNDKLFDDISTDEEENINFVIYKSFNEAIKELRDIFNTNDMNQWNWGELHILELKHLLSENELLEPSLNTNPMAIGGNNTTINNTEYKIFDPFEAVLGSSMRFIADLNDTIVFTALPGGISGDPVNPHYINQVRLWLNGGYIKTDYSKYISEDYELITIIKRKD
jgi:penicillin amidase